MEPTQLKAVECFRGLGLHKEVVEGQPGGVRGKSGDLRRIRK